MMERVKQSAAPASEDRKMRGWLNSLPSLLGVLLIAPAPAAGQSQLPRPTGAHGIGRATLHWTDATRPETQSGKPDARRELLVYLFYPIDPQTTGRRAALARDARAVGAQPAPHPGLHARRV
jgi:hypothetical protein